ncbi:hypothetical protein B2J93_5704 [Marssonina coronariae]|uniref:mRNA 3'-end-processing protein RNA14 n=1 Tax=Diplocarpon coronariae TaxID=2795749 RepID=A0A218ZBL8_9HELO|nr:hypothetical protein B2J93_5704 [Marssonina coronariae]
MVEEDAEIALLHQMQAGQNGVVWDDEGANGAADGELPSNTEHTNDQEVKRENVADDQVLRALSSSASGVGSDDGDYDPASLSSLPAITVAGDVESRSSSRGSTRKPKTVGGFIADDSDDEYDAATPVQAGNLRPSANTSNRAISPSPLHNSVNAQDPSSENQGDSKTAQSYHPPVNSSVTQAAPVPAAAAQMPTSAAPAQGVSLPKARLPHDRIGILEDRIKEDPRGDLDAWLSLISEHRKRNKIDDARAVYERVIKVFPQSAELWVAYTEMELENDNFSYAELLFGRCLMTVPNVQLWLVYLNYIRRRNDLTNDTNGAARATVAQSYDFVLANIGIDKDSGRIWQEYIHFVRGAPGQIGGSSWQDQQKMDQLRKAYQRAINVPMSSLNGLWKEYDQFEMSLNKITGRKFLQEKSPSYMSARSANTALENITRGIARTTLPRLPPAPGFEGDQDYLQQVQLWKGWIQWEQEDPLALKADEPEVYKQRVLYIYKQAVMALRFWPEIWADAADWCFNNGLEKDGDTLLNDGFLANPESCLVAFKKADRLESTLATAEADKDLAERGVIVRAPFDQLLDTLYEMYKSVKVRENLELDKIDEQPYVDPVDASIRAITNAEEDEEDNDAEREYRETAKAARRKVVKDNFSAQSELLSRTISFTWIALMRAMRRVQGKGSPKDAVGGVRKVFADARGRGKITSDVYVAAALIEHHVYKDPAGTKIFERGAKLFPEDARFTLEYLKHLLSINDTTNARVTFETVVGKLTSKPESVQKAKPLYSYFHKYESQYGELSQISKLEHRMAELFPDDPKLSRFASRYSGEGFEPTAIRLIVSPATQTRAKGVMQSIEQPPPALQISPRPQYAPEPSRSPRPQYVQAAITTNSPKRPFQNEDFDSDLNRPRKLARGESPLKGAAGRRLDQQKRLQQGAPNWNAPPFVIPRDITFLLSIIPRADLYTAEKFKPNALVRLLRETIVPDYSTWKQAKEESQAPPPPRPYGKYDKFRRSNRMAGQLQPGTVRHACVLRWTSTSPRG